MSFITREQAEIIRRAFAAPHVRTIFRGSKKLFGALQAYADYHEISRNKAILLLLDIGIRGAISNDLPIGGEYGGDLRAVLLPHWGPE